MATDRDVLGAVFDSTSHLSTEIQTIGYDPADHSDPPELLVLMVDGTRWTLTAVERTD
jgi:hypothetical protein